MSILKQGLFLTALFSILGGSTQAASNVFFLPSGSSPGGTGVANQYSPDPFTQIASFQTPQFATNVLATPNGAKYYVTARAGSDTLWILDGNNLSNTLKKYNLNTQAEAAVITGDGKRVAVVAGQLHVFDTSTDFEISSFSNLNVGNTPIDVAASLDSQYLYVLSSNSGTLYAISLVTGQVTSTFNVPGQSTGVSVGPNGNVYVSAVNRIFELDGRGGGLVQLNAIQLNARPGKVSFSNDGRYAVAVNQTTVTGSIFLLIDLNNKTVTGITNLAGVTLDKLAVVSNNRVFALSNNNQQLYDISLNPLNINGTSFNNSGNIPGITGMGISNELPAARFLFVTTPTSFYRVDLSISPGSQNGQFVNTISAGAIAVAGPTDSYPAVVPTQALFYNTIQSATPGANYSSLIVRVLNSFGRPVANAPVTFTSNSSVLQVQGANQITDGQGYALVNATAPSVAGTYTVTASIASTGVTATYTLSVGSTTNPGGGGNGAIQIVGGNGQIVPEFSISADNFTVKVTDANGQPVANTSVTFSIPAGAATLIPPVTSTTSTTNNVTCASNSCTAQTDVNGLAAVALSSTAVNPGYSFIQTTLTAATTYATTNFVFTTVIRSDRGNQAAPPLIEVLAPTGPIVASAGQTVLGAVKVRVTIQSGPQTGIALSNVGLRVSSVTNNDPTQGPTATCNGGIVLTDSSGVATCDLITGGKIGTTQIIGYVGSIQQTNPITLTVTPGAPSAIRLVQGNNQSGRAGAQLPLAFVAEISDAAGNVLPGASAAWSVVTPGSIILTNIVTVSDSNGRVSALGTLGLLPGPNVVKVTSGTGSASFNFTVNITISAMNKIQGDGQTAFVNSSYPQALVVELRDDQNKVVSGSPVNFSVNTGTASLSPNGGAVTTDSSGRASVSVVAGSLAGTIVIQATAAGFSQTFTLTARPPGPTFDATGIANGASGAAGVVPCGITTISGTNIVPTIQGTVNTSFLDVGLPYSFQGVTVSFNNTPAPIFSVSNINGVQRVTVQAPCELAGQATTSVTIVSGGSTSVQGVKVFAAQPGIFQTDVGSGQQVAIVLRPDGSLVTPTNPALRGEVIRFFTTGLGVVAPASGTNRAGLGGQAVVANLVTGLSDQGADYLTAELSVGMVGVYTISMKVPADTPTGANRHLGLGAYQPDGTLLFSNPSAVAAIQ